MTESQKPLREGPEAYLTETFRSLRLQTTDIVKRITIMHFEIARQKSKNQLLVSCLKINCVLFCNHGLSKIIQVQKKMLGEW